MKKTKFWKEPEVRFICSQEKQSGDDKNEERPQKEAQYNGVRPVNQYLLRLTF